MAISIGTDLTEDRGQGLLIPFPSLRRFFKLVRLSFTSHHLHRCVKLESKDWSCAENLRYDKENKQVCPQLLQGNVDEQVRLEELGGVQPPLEVDGGGVGGAGPTHGPDEEL